MDNADKQTATVLAGGGLAALLASACCVAPLALVTLGISGAWIGNLGLLAPYQLLFSAAAVIALAFAWRRIYRPVADCNDGDVCAQPPTRRVYRIVFWAAAALVLLALAFPLLAPLFY